MGGAVEELAAVGGPAGEGLEVGLRFQNVFQLLFVGIVEDEVGAVVDDLNLVAVYHVEHLARLVGGEGHPVACGVPRGVDGVGEYGVALHVHLLGLAVGDEHGAAVLGADVEEHPAGRVVLVVVAVDAVVLLVVVLAVVLVDGGDVEGLEVALVEAELAVEFVGGFDEAVGEVAVNGFGGHAELVGGEADPAAGALGVEGDGEVLAPFLLEQAAPLEGVEEEFAVVVGSGEHAAAAAFDAAHEGFAGGLHLDVEGSDVGRDGDVAVVGVDACGLARGRALGGYLGFGCRAGRE